LKSPTLWRKDENLTTSSNLARIRIGAHSEEATEKYRKTIELRRQLQREDVLLYRQRGLVPLAIADEMGISLRRVVRILEEAGEEIPGYLTTWNEPPREPCRRCSSDL
jgi:DNA-directed RNA polymerase specialized sigma24 family protein